jgi:hypothetical protein
MPNSFSGTKRTKPMQQQPIPSLWPSIVVFACVAIVAVGALTLLGWIALALMGY